MLKRYGAQSGTLGRSCERGDVCEDPVSLRQIVTSGAIILIVEGVLKVGHIACLILRILPKKNTAHCLRAIHTRDDQSRQGTSFGFTLT